MSNQEMDKELHHNYDGIKEFDNPLPRWWLLTFYATIIFAVVYYYYYEVAGGANLAQELETAMASIKSVQQAAAPAPGGAETEEDLVAAFAAADMAKGEEQYKAKCLACHGDQLQGLIGPNMVDNFWINTKGTKVGMVQIIRTGVADKGMPPWEAAMSKDELIAVAAYISSKHGTNPPNPKAPQGEEVVPQ
jgi:cytochrome c oxidase cbb3-type subunit III